MGTGAYGIVVSAEDSESTNPENNVVAIKKIERAFEHRAFMKQTLRELKVLRLLKHDNIVSVYTIQKPESMKNFKDLYVVYELLETDLGNIIKSPQSLTNEHCQFFLYQILRGMKYVHSAHILHRDLVFFIKTRNRAIYWSIQIAI